MAQESTKKELLRKKKEKEFFYFLFKLIGNKEQRCKEDPCWSKTTIVDPSTLEEVEDGKVGLIRYINLANFNSCSFIQTNDLGFKIGKGFEVIGKASKEEAPGYYKLLNDFLKLF